MKKINLKIGNQLKDECALECLVAVLNHFGETKVKNKLLLRQIGKVEWKWRNWDYLITGLALQKGFRSKIFVRSTQVFDPSWFDFNSKKLIEKLGILKEALEKIVESKKKQYAEFYMWRHPQYELHEASAALDFLKNGGEIVFNKIEDKIIKGLIDKGIPVFFPHNSALLHLQKRKGIRGINDDILGHHWGHVALIIGYDNNNYLIADPNKKINGGHYYAKNKNDVIESIVRFDQNIYAIYR